MPKKRNGKQRRLCGRRTYFTRARSAVVALGLCVVCAAAAATRWGPARRLVGLEPPAEPVVGENLPLSKEYVYAGGRLVATEEPAPAATPTPVPAGPSPTALVATGFFPSPNAAAVRLVWAAPSSGSPTGYVVERAYARDAGGLAYATVGAPVKTLPTQSNPYVDQTAAPDAVYIYRVKAAYTGGYSGGSNQDVATTVRYTGDDPLIGSNDPQRRRPSPVRAADLTQLRSVVESVRALAGVGAGVWKNDPAPRSGGAIPAAHFAELRTNLNQALSALGIATLPDDPTLGVNQRIRAAHVQDLRDKVR